MAQCTQRQEDSGKYEEDITENFSDDEGEISEDDIIIEMVKQASLHTCQVGGDEDHVGENSMRGHDDNTSARDIGDSSDSSGASLSLMRMVRRIGARSAQSRALASDHIVLQEESEDSDAFDGYSSSEDQNADSNAGEYREATAPEQYERTQARKGDHVHLQEADDFD